MTDPDHRARPPRLPGDLIVRLSQLERSSTQGAENRTSAEHPA